MFTALALVVCTASFVAASAHEVQRLLAEPRSIFEPAASASMSHPS